MTEPAGTVKLEAVVIAPTVRLAAVNALLAAACVSPTTSGTATCDSPDDTARSTAPPGRTARPAAGVELITKPEGTVALATVVTAPTESPAAMIAPRATASVEFTTFGTAIEVPDRRISTAAR